jgi:hypothetical protein
MTRIDSLNCFSSVKLWGGVRLQDDLRIEALLPGQLCFGSTSIAKNIPRVPAPRQQGGAPLGCAIV